MRLVPSARVRKDISLSLDERDFPMPPSSHRVLKRKGRIALVETANPAIGNLYSVRIGTLGLWSGDNLADAERQFEQATRQDA